LPSAAAVSVRASSFMYARLVIVIGHPLCAM
jgi:hypothetical protein